MKCENGKCYLILPCPFCGGEAKINLFVGNYCVTCTECMGGIMPAPGQTQEEAIEAWNKRVGEE